MKINPLIEQPPPPLTDEDCAAMASGAAAGEPGPLTQEEVEAMASIDAIADAQELSPRSVVVSLDDLADASMREAALQWDLEDARSALVQEQARGVLLRRRLADMEIQNAGQSQLLRATLAGPAPLSDPDRPPPNQTDADEGDSDGEDEG